MSSDTAPNFGTGDNEEFSFPSNQAATQQRASGQNSREDLPVPKEEVADNPRLTYADNIGRNLATDKLNTVLESNGGDHTESAGPQQPYQLQSNLQSDEDGEASGYEMYGEQQVPSGGQGSGPGSSSSSEGGLLKNVHVLDKDSRPGSGRQENNVSSNIRRIIDGSGSEDSGLMENL